MHVFGYHVSNPVPSWVSKLSLLGLATAMSVTPVAAKDAQVFNRIATFPAYLNSSADIESVSEILDVSKDGKILVYTDGTAEKLGFVDIQTPSTPKALGAVDMGGEPTSVAIVGNYVLAAVDTSPSFTQPSGKLVVLDLKTRQIITTHALNGQPDSIAVSPNGRYAAIAIENERDESFGDGAPPQAPGGFLNIVDLKGKPEKWTLRNVSFTGVPDLFPEDPEPEYVDINAKNIAAVTLQENNHLMFVDLKRGTLLSDFSAGTVNLSQIDTKKDSPALISLTGTATDVRREPDGISWIDTQLFATANEGDLVGGSRGFTVFDMTGKTIYDSGNTLDHATVALGHYLDSRNKKGNEPENVDAAKFGRDQFLFVASERTSLIFVYKVNDKGQSYELVQTLPAGTGPEGIKAVPKHNLLVSAGEVDNRTTGRRAVVTIYQYQKGAVNYPTVMSEKRSDGTPIPWGALSGLAIDLQDDNKGYTIHDSYYQQSRIYALNLSSKPAKINAETVLKDDNGLVAAIMPTKVNSDKTVNLDMEGIATTASGGFWVASEGAGAASSSTRTFNLLLHVTTSGVIDKVVQLPEATNAKQVQYGFEGVASVGSGNNEVLFVAFQREWSSDPANHARIGRYEVATGQWSYYYYPLDTPTSPNGGWVGLSEIVALSANSFAVIERDNQSDNNARLKRIYSFSVANLLPAPEPVAGVTPVFPVVSKTLERDVLSDLQKASSGLVLEKIEGLARNSKGDAWLVNDNDGVDGTNGETQLLQFKELLK